MAQIPFEISKVSDKVSFVLYLHSSGRFGRLIFDVYSYRPEEVEYQVLPFGHSFRDIVVSEVSIPPMLRILRRDQLV